MLAAWVPAGSLNETTRLGPSPANRQVPPPVTTPVTTPFGPEMLLLAVPFELSLTPANGGDAVICVMNFNLPVAALTTSTAAFERSPR